MLREQRPTDRRTDQQSNLYSRVHATKKSVLPTPIRMVSLVITRVFFIPIEGPVFCVVVVVVIVVVVIFRLHRLLPSSLIPFHGSRGAFLLATSELILRPTRTRDHHGNLLAENNYGGRESYSTSYSSSLPSSLLSSLSFLPVKGAFALRKKLQKFHFLVSKCVGVLV